MIVQILYSILAVGGLGILFGVVLAVFGKVLAVEKDERVSKVEGLLPGVNCGTCGFAGCSAYAEAIVQEGAAIDLCSPGGGDTIKAIGQVMGQEVEVSGVKMVAQVHCRGTRQNAVFNFTYTGVKDCNALYALYGGDKACPYGCLLQGSCIKVCPVDAIDYDEEGNVVVDKEKCISCGQCIAVCPTKVMKFVPYDADYYVSCNSTDKGALVKKYCSVGCIGCRMCAKASPDGGFNFEGDFLPRVDYSKKGDRKPAADKCPPKCILKND